MITKTKTTFLTLFLFLSIIYLNAQQLPGDSLISDFKCLIKYMEETHPDPYSGFGGKVSFHKSAYDIQQKLKAGATKEEFENIITSFFANLEDGHTYLIKENNTNTQVNLSLPVNIRASSDGLRLIVVPEENKDLLGSKILSINHIPIDTLLQKVRLLYPVENLYGAYCEFSMQAIQYKEMKKILPDVQREILFTLETPSKTIQDLALPYLDKEESQKIELTYRPRWEKIKEPTLMYFDFLDNENQAMLFKLGSTYSRDVFIYMNENNWPSLESSLKMIYDYPLMKEMPANLEEAIAGIPQLSELFRDMLEEMKKNQSKYLIIDLRDNSGGFSPILDPTLYQLYGDKYLAERKQSNLYRLISPLFLQKRNTTLEKFNEDIGMNLNYGEYFFVTDKSEELTLEEKREKFIENILAGVTEPIADLNGQPIYTPEKVFVLMNEFTFSAAFHYTFHLWKMGATTIGLPPSQSPNAFMESTNFTLPYTKVQGSISNSVLLFFPADHERAKIFYPEMMLTADDYKKYNFDKHSDLLYLLDSLHLNYTY